MKRLNGVQKAELDLNSGEARLVFSGSHDTSLQQIQRSIIDGGFSPKEARIKIKGAVHNENGMWLLTTEAGDRFILDTSYVELAEAHAEKAITMEGIEAERKNADYWHTKVRETEHA